MEANKITINGSHLSLASLHVQAREFLRILKAGDIVARDLICNVRLDIKIEAAAKLAIQEAIVIISSQANIAVNECTIWLGQIKNIRDLILKKLNAETNQTIKKLIPVRTKKITKPIDFKGLYIKAATSLVNHGKIKSDYKVIVSGTEIRSAANIRTFESLNLDTFALNMGGNVTAYGPIRMEIKKDKAIGAENKKFHISDNANIWSEHGISLSSSIEGELAGAWKASKIALEGHDIVVKADIASSEANIIGKKLEFIDSQIKTDSLCISDGEVGIIMDALTRQLDNSISISKKSSLKAKDLHLASTSINIAGLVKSQVLTSVSNNFHLLKSGQVEASQRGKIIAHIKATIEGVIKGGTVHLKSSELVLTDSSMIDVELGSLKGNKLIAGGVIAADQIIVLSDYLNLLSSSRFVGERLEIVNNIKAFIKGSIDAKHVRVSSNGSISIEPKASITADESLNISAAEIEIAGLVESKILNLAADYISLLKEGRILAEHKGHVISRIKSIIEGTLVGKENLQLNGRHLVFKGNIEAHELDISANFLETLSSSVIKTKDLSLLNIVQAEINGIISAKNIFIKQSGNILFKNNAELEAERILGSAQEIQMSGNVKSQLFDFTANKFTLLAEGILSIEQEAHIKANLVAAIDGIIKGSNADIELNSRYSVIGNTVEGNRIKIVGDYLKLLSSGKLSASASLALEHEIQSEISGVLESKSIDVKGKDFVVAEEGSIQADQANIEAEQIWLSGDLKLGTLDLVAKHLSVLKTGKLNTAHSSHIEASLVSLIEGVITSGENLYLEGSQVFVSGSLSADSANTIIADTLQLLEDGTLSSEEKLNLVVSTRALINGSILAKNIAIDSKSGMVYFQDGSTVEGANVNLEIADSVLAGSIKSAYLGIISSKFSALEQAIMSGQSVDIIASGVQIGAIIESSGQLRISSDSLQLYSGNQKADEVSLKGKSLVLASQLNATGDLKILVESIKLLKEGSILANKIDIKSKLLSEINGILFAHDIQINSDDKVIFLDQSQVIADNELKVCANQIVTNGKIRAALVDFFADEIEILSSTAIDASTKLLMLSHAKTTIEGLLSGDGDLYIKGEKVFLGEKSRAYFDNKAVIEAHKLIHEGQIVGRENYLLADHIEVKKNAYIGGASTKISGTDTNILGFIDSQNVFIEGEKLVVGQDSDDDSLMGKVKADLLTIISEVVRLESSSILNASENAFVKASKSLILNGILSTNGGILLDHQGRLRVNENEMAMFRGLARLEAKYAEINGSVYSGQVSIEAKKSLLISGYIHGSESIESSSPEIELQGWLDAASDISLSGKRLSSAEGSKISAGARTKLLFEQELSLYGILAGTDISIKGKTVSLGKTSHIQGENVGIRYSKGAIEGKVFSEILDIIYTDFKLLNLDLAEDEEICIADHLRGFVKQIQNGLKIYSDADQLILGEHSQIIARQRAFILGTKIKQMGLLSSDKMMIAANEMVISGTVAAQKLALLAHQVSQSEDSSISGQELIISNAIESDLLNFYADKVFSESETSLDKLVDTRKLSPNGKIELAGEISALNLAILAGKIQILRDSRIQVDKELLIDSLKSSIQGSLSAAENISIQGKNIVISCESEIIAGSLLQILSSESTQLLGTLSGEKIILRADKTISSQAKITGVNIGILSNYIELLEDAEINAS